MNCTSLKLKTSALWKTCQNNRNTDWDKIFAKNISYKGYLLKTYSDFPGSPVVKTLHFHCRKHGFDPWSGN